MNSPPHRQRLLLKTLAVVAAAALGGCQDASNNRSETGSEKSLSPDRGDGSDAAVTKADVKALFLDKVAFTTPELTGGKTNCDDILRRADLASDIVPWPKELRDFLADQLFKTPIRTQINDSVFAIYLVKEDVLKDDTERAAAAGLACDRGTDYKGIIFLNASTFINDRQSKGVGVWQDLRSIQETHILFESGDNAVMTLFHEVVHAIDNKLFMNGIDDSLRIKRSEIFNLSWKSHTEPLYDRISVLSLTDGEVPSVVETGCRTRSRGEIMPEPQTTLSLTAITGEKLGADLKYLAEKTNFIVPYATATAAEDFAESMTVYYYGVYENNWQNRTVYKENITDKGTGDATVVYAHKTKDIMKSVKAQKDKLCLMANLVFGACKLP